MAQDIFYRKAECNDTQSYSLSKGGLPVAERTGSFIVVCWRLPKKIKHITNEFEFLLDCIPGSVGRKDIKQ